MSSREIWVSRVPQDSTLIKGFRSDVHDADPKRAIDAMRCNKRAEPLPQDRFPTEMSADPIYQRKLKTLPDISLSGGFWVVSKAVAEILSRFDLGQGALYPVEMWRWNQKDRIGDGHFCLNLGAVKEAFVPEESRVRENLYTPGHYSMRGDVKVGDVAVTSAALEGPDLWIDPTLESAFFLSGPLVAELREAKLTRRFGLRKARVVDGG